MRVKWYGHASFLLTSDRGLKIITDPYEPGGFGGAVAYGSIPDPADVVLVSHEHADHNYVQGIPGNPIVFRGEGIHRAQDLQVQGLGAFHDDSQGSQRGKNTVFCFSLDGLRLCHVGDLGDVPSDELAEQIGRPDVLFMPVGGLYTIDPVQASRTADKLTPRVIIPMHFKTPHCGFPLAEVDDFLRGKAAVKRLSASEVAFTPESLPESTEIIVLEPAL